MSEQELSRAPLALEQLIWAAMVHNGPYVACNGDVQTDSYTRDDGPYPRVRRHLEYWLLDPSYDGDVKVYTSTDDLKRALEPLLRGVTP